MQITCVLVYGLQQYNNTPQYTTTTHRMYCCIRNNVIDIHIIVEEETHRLETLIILYDKDTFIAELFYN